MPNENLRRGLERKADEMKRTAQDSRVEVACKYCGCGGLKWKDVQGRWRLEDPETGELHNCPKKKDRPVPTEMPATPFDQAPGSYTSGAYFGRFTAMLQVLPGGWRVELERKTSGGWRCRVLLPPFTDSPEWHDGIQPADAFYRALSVVPSEDNMNKEGVPCPEASGYPTSTE